MDDTTARIAAKTAERDRLRAQAPGGRRNPGRAHDRPATAC